MIKVFDVINELPPSRVNVITNTYNLSDSSNVLIWSVRRIKMKTLGAGLTKDLPLVKVIDLNRYPVDSTFHNTKITTNPPQLQGWARLFRTAVISGRSLSRRLSDTTIPPSPSLAYPD